MRFGSTELLILLVVVVLLFGTSRIPKLARSLRQARDELETDEPSPESVSAGPKVNETGRPTP